MTKCVINLKQNNRLNVTMYTLHVYMMYSIVTCKASVVMVAVVAVVAVAVAPHGQSDGDGHDHSLAVISRPSLQP